MNGLFFMLPMLLHEPPYPYPPIPGVPLPLWLNVILIGTALGLAYVYYTRKYKKI